MQKRVHRRRHSPEHMGIDTFSRRIARRVPATFDLGRDRDAPLVARSIARLVSAYERAPLLWWLQEFLVAPMFLDAGPLWLARRLAFALAGRERGDDEPDHDDRELSSSGWRGSLLVLAVWTLAALLGLAALLWLLAGEPNSA